MKKILMLSAALGAMTAAERSTGRYMRAPDGHEAEDGGFAEFEKAGEVEVGSTKDAIETNIPEEKPAKPAKPAARAAKPAAAAEKPADDKAAKAGEEGEEVEDGAEGEEATEEAPKKPKPASERIRELNRRLRDSERLRLADGKRLDEIEKRLQGGDTGGNKTTGKAPPDATDEEKYPLGHLDDRYLEDKLEWLAEEKATKMADAVLHRQQEGEQQARAEKAHAELLDKVEDLSTRGAEISDDFQEAVVEGGMRGDWLLGQATFEAAHEATNGAQILYDLSQDTKEAKRVSRLSPYQQMRFVMDRDTEITAKAPKPRTKPGAGEPPATTTRGASSSARINPATDSLTSFEKAWIADAKGNS